MAGADGGIGNKLLDLTITRQLLLQRVAAGQARQLDVMLLEIADEIRDALTVTVITDYQGRRLIAAIRELQTLIVLTPLAETLQGEMNDLAAIEAKATANALKSVVSVGVALPSATVLSSIATSSLVQGATIGQWFSRLESKLQFDIERSVRLGMSLGETNQQIGKRILGLRSEDGPDLIPKARRDVQSIVRTSVQTVANNAKQAVYQQNDDIVTGVRWVSTLDSRTTDICMARSGKVWTLDYKPKGHKIPWNGGPPAHWACRSTTIAEIDPEVMSLGAIERASADGPVSADLSFDDFLKSKPSSFADEMLGNGRAQMWRDGKITLSQLLDQRGNPLTLKELQRRYH